MTPAQRQQLFERLAQANPHPTTELIWHTPFQLLLAVLLSAQSTDVGVNRVTAPLFPTLQTPQDLLTLGLAAFEEAIRTLGLYRTKSRHAIEMAKILVDQHEGQVPETQVELEALPGVGRKTANVVLNTLYGHPTIAVDTHVFRVANRTGLARGTTPLAVEQALLRAVPAPFLQHAHHWLILQGRHICLARAPRCGICPIQDLCDTGKIHV
ncbi:endonuclease III [Ferrovum myxofaciens]|uniref:endonuclease III n=1 Tax=Ferrovum myxofaciens TaxID=416213 RepID=UPI0004E1679F|nr:endonuclease III [Ferrovum myxofaciens]QKE40521.1 MAG: endonuclease III [Ferrovum myxofaciens]